MTTRKRLTDIVREEVQKSKLEPALVLEVEELEQSAPVDHHSDPEVQQLKNQLAAAQELNAQLQSELERTQAYLAQASQLKTDLDQALSENQRLKLELEQQKTPALLPRADQEKMRLSQLMYRPVGSNAEQNRINNQNIGWFD
ncbi:MAG: hypothetical protein SFT94_08560 [Pseudanabaenaceae cyanobacterium bins.68]|nr:hypothetical protein [Pseudanabaenaceae cyanobacterium bins.68]